MVTIEQKLTLFSKLLHQDIKEEIDKKIIDMEQEYEKRVRESKESADKMAENIVNNAVKRAEAKKTELISKSKMASKREGMLAKERYVAVFMERLKAKVKDFTLTDAYKDYLNHYIKQFEDLKNYENPLVIYMTKQDYDSHKKFIKEKLISLGLDKDKLNFEMTDDSILGGIIIEDPQLSMRIDTSIATLLQDSKAHIIESLFGAIGEVGETLE